MDSIGNFFFFLTLLQIRHRTVPDVGSLAPGTPSRRGTDTASKITGPLLVRYSVQGLGFRVKDLAFGLGL